MRPECSHTLPNGKQCRCLALRGQTRCLHHLAAGQRPPARRPRNVFSHISRWRELGRHLPQLPAAEIPFSVYIILGSLIGEGDDGISDREAGRLLRALLRRHGSVPFPPPEGVLVESDPAIQSAAAPPAQPRSFPPEFTRLLPPELVDQLLQHFATDTEAPGLAATRQQEGRRTK